MYFVLRNARRATSPDSLPNLLGTLDHDDSNRCVCVCVCGGVCVCVCVGVLLGQIVPGNFGGKAVITFDGASLC